jgi:hypothetical protein
MTLLFLPIDIELPDSILNLNVKKEHKESVRLTKYNPYWNSTIITKSHSIFDTIKPVIDQLPFDNITTVTHKIQDRAVGPHVDVYPDMVFQEGELDNIKLNEPSGYRILIKGQNGKLEIFNGKDWVAPILPKVPCCYLINSTTTSHRVKEDENRELLYVRGFLNNQKHLELIKKSYIKYGQYAVEQLL